MINAMKNFAKTSLFLLLTTALSAQTPKEPSMPDMLQEMRQLHQQLLQQFREITPNGFDNGGMTWDTSYTFRIDTFFNGARSDGGFFFSPFGGDSTFFHQFWKADPFSWDDNPFGGFRLAIPPGMGFPENEENEALEDRGDGLLPEQRLRNESGVPETPPAEPGKPPAQDTKKPKIKTIRI